jgi:hypothetical protein
MGYFRGSSASGSAMSALGTKRTCRDVPSWFVLEVKADIVGISVDVR